MELFKVRNLLRGHSFEHTESSAVQAEELITCSHSGVPMSISSSGGVLSSRHSLLNVDPNLLKITCAIIYQQLIISGDIETNPGPVACEYD